MKNFVILYKVYTLFLSPAKENIGGHFEYSSLAGEAKWNGADYWDDSFVNCIKSIYTTGVFRGTVTLSLSFRARTIFGPSLYSQLSQLLPLLVILFSPFAEYSYVFTGYRFRAAAEL